MSRAVSLTDLYNKKIPTLKLDGEWKDALGNIGTRGTIFIYGKSGNGKSTFTAMLAKYLTRFGKVAYNSLEEGVSETLKMNFDRVGMREVGSKLLILDKEPINEMRMRLRRQKAPEIVIIDSIQYTKLKFDEYKHMADEHKVLFIVVSQIKGKEPKGKLADDIYYHSDVKIWVEGYRAFVRSRYKSEEGPPITVWKAGADKYWGTKF